MRQTLTVRPTPDQALKWSDAAARLNKPVRAFMTWSADYMARYTLEVYVQDLHRAADPILLRLDEKKLLRAVVDAAWHALDFLPPPFDSPVSGAIRDPKGDLRKALEALHEHLEEVQEEYR